MHNYYACHFSFMTWVIMALPNLLSLETFSYVYSLYQLTISVIYSHKIVKYVSNYVTLSFLLSVKLLSVIFSKTTLYVQELSAYHFWFCVNVSFIFPFSVRLMLPPIFYSFVCWLSNIHCYKRGLTLLNISAMFSFLNKFFFVY